MCWNAVKHALDANVLVDVRPVDALAGADKSKACSLTGCRPGEAPRPSQRNADDPAVRETRDELVCGNPDMLDAGLGANRSVHAMPSESLVCATR
jgi:hypothetical protein